MQPRNNIRECLIHQSDVSESVNCILGSISCLVLNSTQVSFLISDRSTCIFHTQAPCCVSSICRCSHLYGCGCAGVQMRCVQEQTMVPSTTSWFPVRSAVFFLLFVGGIAQIMRRFYKDDFSMCMCSDAQTERLLSGNQNKLYILLQVLVPGLCVGFLDLL